MLLGDLITAVTYELPVKLVVFDNGRLGMVKLEQEQGGLPEFGTVLANPDLAAVARAIGLQAASASRTPTTLDDARPRGARPRRPGAARRDHQPRRGLAAAASVEARTRLGLRDRQDDRGAREPRRVAGPSGLGRSRMTPGAAGLRSGHGEDPHPAARPPAGVGRRGERASSARRGSTTSSTPAGFVGRLGVRRRVGQARRRRAAPGPQRRVRGHGGRPHLRRLRRLPLGGQPAAAANHGRMWGHAYSVCLSGIFVAADSPLRARRTWPA